VLGVKATPLQLAFIAPFTTDATDVLPDASLTQIKSL